MSKFHLAADNLTADIIGGLLVIALAVILI